MSLVNFRYLKRGTAFNMLLNNLCKVLKNKVFNVKCFNLDIFLSKPQKQPNLDQCRFQFDVMILSEDEHGLIQTRYINKNIYYVFVFRW